MKERSGMPYDVVAYEADENAMLLTPEQEGLFHRLLRRSWMNGSIPDDVEKCAVICRVTKLQMKRNWDAIRPLWVKSSIPGRLVNAKQESEREWKEKYSAAQAERGHLGGIAKSKSKPAKSASGGGGPLQSGRDEKQEWNPPSTTVRTNSDLNDTGYKSRQNIDSVVANAKQTPSSRLASLPSPSPSPIPNPEDYSNIQDFVRPEEADGRAIKTNQTSKVPEEKRRGIWAPIEASLRADVEDDTFARFYAGCEVVDATAREVVLAVPLALIQRNENSLGVTSRIMTNRIVKVQGSENNLLRGRPLRIIPLEQPS